LRVIETTEGPNQYLYVGLSAGAVESLMKWSLLSQASCSLMKIQLTLFLSYISWVLSNIIMEYSPCRRECDRNPGQRFCISVLPKMSGRLFTYLFTPSIGSPWSLWVVTAASTCCFMVKVMVRYFVSDFQGYDCTHSCCLLLVLPELKHWLLSNVKCVLMDFFLQYQCLKCRL
jgi:hypothetical protein